MSLPQAGEVGTRWSLKVPSNTNHSVILLKCKRAQRSLEKKKKTIHHDNTTGKHSDPIWANLWLFSSPEDLFIISILQLSFAWLGNSDPHFHGQNGLNTELVSFYFYAKMFDVSKCLLWPQTQLRQGLLTFLLGITACSGTNRHHQWWQQPLFWAPWHATWDFQMAGVLSVLPIITICIIFSENDTCLRLRHAQIGVVGLS